MEWNYRGCRYAKEEMLKKKQPQETPKNKSARVFSPTSQRQIYSYLSLQLSETRLNNRGNKTKSQAVPSTAS
jgi:hypothetical protein